jgi:perosamine synthetase
MMRIPLSSVDLSGEEEAYLLDAFRSTWISSSGRYVTEFEQRFAELIGTGAAAAVSNGTVALHLAMLALELGVGDEVIVPALTYVATANCVRYVGADPVFVDVDPATWCLDPKLIEAAITPRTKGIIAVHLYGHPADMDEINRIAARHGLWVVEDAAEAHLATYKGRMVGGLSTIGTFSFYGNKILTCGEGGSMTYSGEDLDRRIRMLRGHGMDPARRYYFPIVGYNYRLSNLACALLCAQLSRQDEIVRRRREIYDHYQSCLDGIPGVCFQPVAPWAQPTPWLFSVTIADAQFGCTRDRLSKALAAEGIDTRPFFIPLHFLPPYQDEGRYPEGKFPVSEELGATGINLPTFTALKNEEIEFVSEAIRKVQRSQAPRRMRAQ